MEITNDKYLNELIDTILNNKYSMVSKQGFKAPFYEKNRIDSLDGDIVECGVWKGGMSLYLNTIFPNKKIWLVDSYKNGFQDLKDMKYQTTKIDDPHKKGTSIRDGVVGIDIQLVKDIFNKFGKGNDPNINYLEGYVGETLKPEICPIKKISLLRIDVDSYSGTLEVLDYLYPKVESGGVIIFDDAGIDSARLAIQDYFEREKIVLNTYPPECGELRSGLSGEACYMIKSNL